MSEDIKLPIYMDHHATTPLDPRVLEKMLPYFTEDYGNAASKSHRFGQRAHQAVEKAREQLSQAINAQPQEIIWTSGATEAINLAIKGLAEEQKTKKHFVTVVTEHKAVLDCFKWLEKHGYETTYLSVDREGLIDPSELKKIIHQDTALVSVMFANNEIGVIQPIEEIGEICRDQNCFFMTDATQALGREIIDVERMNIDLLACSGHKIYGPKGIGALYVRRSNPRVKLTEQINGGGHERGMRSGTLNVPAIVGFGEATELAVRKMKTTQPKIRELRNYLLKQLKEAIPGLIVNGSMTHRLAGNLNISLPGIDADALVIALQDTVAISTGSACTSAKVEPSHVLQSIHKSTNSIRMYIDRSFSRESLNYILLKILNKFQRLKRINLN